MSVEMIMVDVSQSKMWTLSADRRSVRMQVPDLPITSLPEPIRVHLDFEADTVDEILERLTVLRSLMLPAPQRN